MSGNNDDKKLNQTLFGVNIVLLTLLVIGMIVYFNIRHKRKVEIEEHLASKQKQVEPKADKDAQIVDMTTKDLQLPSREDTALSSESVPLDTDDKEAVMADVSDTKSDSSSKVSIAEDIKDIMKEETQAAANEGLVGEMSIDYNKGKDLLSGTDRARLILLESDNMKLVDKLVDMEPNQNAGKDKKPSALDKAADNSNGRRPNYGKVRKGLIGVAEALVRLNSKIVEVEPLKKDEDQEAVTSLEYGP